MAKDYERIQEILKDYKEQLDETDNTEYPVVKRALRCICQNLFRKKLTVGWLKERCRINGSSFATKFYYSVERYPKEYILDHRLEVAKRLLKETNATITLIAISVGFNSLSAFCKTFKRREGLKPSEWRCD
jgi:AraC-like DNA-binding protein